MARARKRPTTNTVLRIRMSDVRAAGMWRIGYATSANITTDGCTPVRITLDCTQEPPVLLHNNQHILLVGIPSNIGRGTVYYFVCPVTGTRCRTLYYVPGARLLVSRGAIRPGVVYPSQSFGRVNMYHYLSARLEREQERRATTTYCGKVTRRAAMVTRLEQRVEDYHGYAIEALLREMHAVLRLPNLNNLG